MTRRMYVSIVRPVSLFPPKISSIYTPMSISAVGVLPFCGGTVWARRKFRRGGQKCWACRESRVLPRLCRPRPQSRLRARGIHQYFWGLRPGRWCSRVSRPHNNGYVVGWGWPWTPEWTGERFAMFLLEARTAGPKMRSADKQDFHGRSVIPRNPRKRLPAEGTRAMPRRVQAPREWPGTKWGPQTRRMEREGQASKTAPGVQERHQMPIAPGPLLLPGAVARLPSFPPAAESPFFAGQCARWLLAPLLVTGPGQQATDQGLLWMAMGAWTARPADGLILMVVMQPSPLPSDELLVRHRGSSMFARRMETGQGCHRQP